MKIHIGPYKHWFGTYQLAEKLCFWVKKERDEYGIPRYPDWVHDFGEFLTYGKVEEKKREPHKFLRDDREVTWLFKFLSWIDRRKERKVDIQIEKFDTWGMDSTLAMIIVPMLKQLKETTHGYPGEFADDPFAKQRSFEGDGWDLPEDSGADKWDEILDKMIWAFEQVNEDWEDQYRSGEIVFDCIPCEDSDNWELVKAPEDTSEADYDGMRRHEERMQEGFDLFAKYFRNLWD